jgi:hypothetical protein
MPDTHRRVGTHKGYTIYQREPGFEFTPVMLGKIASFFVRHEDGGWIVFAFMYPMIPHIEDKPADEEARLQTAAGVIQECIDVREIDNHAERTFEFRYGRWEEVIAPRWWIPTFR